jgi:hypothetical protein
MPIAGNDLQHHRSEGLPSQNHTNSGLAGVAGLPAGPGPSSNTRIGDEIAVRTQPPEYRETDRLMRDHFSALLEGEFSSLQEPVIISNDIPNLEHFPDGYFQGGYSQGWYYTSQLRRRQLF